MHLLLQNKFVRFTIIGITALLAIFFVLLFLASMNSVRSTGLSNSDMMYAPSFNTSPEMGMSVSDSMGKQAESSYYYPPQPSSDGYTSELESYETTAYNVTARTKDFDTICDEVSNLKGDSQIHFRTITSNLNNCYASFFVETEKVDEVLATLTKYRGVEISRDTESVTRHKQKLESQTTILQQQLARIESSLTAAETQLTRLNQLFNSSDEVTRLSSEVTKSLQYIDQLTRQKINLISQLDNLYQQSTDLAERMDVVQFDVNITRVTPIVVDKYERQWDRAWEELKDQFTDTLIGVTAFFGIILLLVIQYTLYLLVLILILRGVWKFIQFIWKKW